LQVISQLAGTDKIRQNNRVKSEIGEFQK